MRASRCVLARSRVGFALDVDGVLISGKHVLPQGVRALQFLQSSQIPFVLLTNGGGDTEEAWCEAFQREYGYVVDPRQVVLAHTPCKKYVPQLREKLVVVFGRKQPIRAARNYGFEFAVTPEQYCTLFPGIFAFASYNEVVDDRLKQMILSQPVAAALFFSDPMLWGRDCQLIVDMARKGEWPKGGLPTRDETNALQLVFCNPDLHWSSNFPAPRFAQGMFRMALESIYKHEMLETMQFEVMGKPTRVTYDWASELLDCDRMYGVGDNQLADIAGANFAGERWRSVLVRTGLYKGGPLQVQPHYIFNDVLEAVTTLQKQV